jgi:MraZ protein
MLFLGKHEYSMDERGRVPMPPRYREALMRGLVLTEGTPENCLRAYPADDFERQAELYLSRPVTTEVGRDARTVIFGSAEAVELDRQGRVLIPSSLREFAGLRGPIVVIGNGDSFLIWDAQSYETHAAATQERYRQSLGSE